MIYGFLDAHGYDPGPSQRPMLAGSISGILATVPAIGVLVAFGSLRVESEILGLSSAETLAVGWAAMAIAGAAYARFFGRAANAVRGGWLFGIVWGLATGILVPFVHRPLHESLDKASKSAAVGPGAAAAKNGPIKQRRQESKR